MDVLCLVVLVGLTLGVLLLLLAFVLTLGAARRKPIDRVRAQAQRIEQDTISQVHRIAQELERTVAEQTKPYR